MSVLMGDSGKSAAGTLKTFTFSYPTPIENVFAPITLPTTEPGTSQYIYTIQQSDFPTITPTPRSVKFLACIITGGRMATAGIINYRILKNGVSVVTSATGSIPLNNYWALTNWRWFDVQVGDVLEVRMWSSVADSVYDYSAFVGIQPTQVFLTPPNVIAKDISMTNIFQTLSNGLAWTTGNLTFHPFTTTVSNLGIGSGSFTLPALVQNSTAGFFKMNNGDVSGTSTTGNGVHATQRPFYQRNILPTSISFREVLR